MTREQVMEMGYELIGKSLSLEIFAHFHKDGMVSIYQFETDIPTVVQDCGHVLLSEEVFYKIVDMKAANDIVLNGNKMKLEQKRFNQSIWAITELLTQVYKSKLREHSLVIVKGPFADTDILLNICKNNRISFAKHKNLRFSYNDDSSIVDTIKDFITAKSSISNNKNIFICTNGDIDFKEFEDIYNVTIYHYIYSNNDESNFIIK